MLHIYTAHLTEEVKAAIIKALEMSLVQGDVRKYSFRHNLFVFGLLCVT